MMQTAPHPALTANTIIKIVAAEAGVSVDVLTSHNRGTAMVRARCVAMLLIREFKPSVSRAHLARMLGHRDHTTVLYALVKAPNWLAADAKMASIMENSRTRLLAWVPEAKICVVQAEPDPAPLPPPRPARRTPPAVKYEPPATAVYSPTKGNGDWNTEQDWQARECAKNEARFMRAMLAVHPERCPATMKEAAE